MATYVGFSRWCGTAPYKDKKHIHFQIRNRLFMRVFGKGVNQPHMQIPDGADAHGFRSAPVGEGDDIGNGYGDGITSTRISNRWSSEFFHNQESAPVSRYRLGSTRWSNASRNGVPAPMSLFQTKKQHSSKIEIFGPFPLGDDLFIGAGRSGLYRGKWKEFLDNRENLVLDQIARPGHDKGSWRHFCNR